MRWYIFKGFFFFGRRENINLFTCTQLIIIILKEYFIYNFFISELAKGPCLTEYRWNSGGTFKGKEWNSELPSDAVVRIIL